MEKTYEAELPQGYREVLHINAADKKLGLILNAVALVVLVAVAGLAGLLIFLNRDAYSAKQAEAMLPALIVFLVSLIAYVILHELLHGLAYKLLTHQKLAFGMKWSCAFCGVPNIYTYRKTALIALLTPFSVFSVLLLGGTVALFFINPFCFWAAACLLGMHLGGCSGDLYMTYLLCKRFKASDVLVRDTGPEQFIYLRSEDGEIPEQTEPSAQGEQPL